MRSFSIKNLFVSINDKPIVKGLTLTVKPGEIHAIMGPNGSGKSTSVYALSGHPRYSVTAGSASLDGQDLLALSIDERARAGLFVAFQYPVEVAGVKVVNFLKVAYEQRFAHQPDRLFAKAIDFRKHVEGIAEQLQVKKELLYRGLNEGFSGGEKKCLEILQMAILEPTYVLMDETDSGLDIDAIKTVAQGARMIIAQHNIGAIVITHYNRILEYLQPDFVHVMRDGKIVQSGGKEVVEQLEKHGYATTE